ncbi:MAG TPA: M42 family metallopeptidase [Anaerolineales bacterium]|nr:M42 family metallopeptidase [Anaerolineales bacterium]
MKQLIQRLVEITAPSGHETQMRAAIRAEVEPLADEVRVDALGNLIAQKGRLPSGRRNEGEGQRIMIAAHMDEIGLMVTHIDESGFARFTNLGGVRPHSLPGGRVNFIHGPIGVIGVEHKAATNEAPTLAQMFIDLGVTSREACPVRIGDVACFERQFLDLGDRLVAKAMDDRVGIAVLIETMRQLKSTPHELHFVFTTQEEVGLRGAAPAAFGIDPDLGLAVDVTGTGDTPQDKKMEVKLGQGPAIKIRDAQMISDPRVVDWMASAAEELRLPHQFEILEAGSTDARAIQLSRAGVPAGCLSIPCRYIHSPSEMVELHDILNAVKLLTRLLSEKVVMP